MAGLAFSIVSTGIFLVLLFQDLLKPNLSKATIVTFIIGSTGIADNGSRIDGNPPQVSIYAKDGS
jgi:hypothetical protein